MLLAVDIGNTNISFGLFAGKKLVKRFNLPTGKYSLQKVRAELGSLKLDDSIICSVVPNTNKSLHKDLELLLQKRPYLVGSDTLVPMKNRYRKPLEVGQDRLVNAYAGTALYGAPLVVVDFGTAITFDVISKNKEYLGGMIIPGLSISLDALAERTALLPRIKLGKPREFIGRDTKNSILSGIIYGFAALTDDLAKRIKSKIGRSAKVVGTGGNIHLIADYCAGLGKIDADLTLKGLNLIYNQRRK